MGSSSKRTAPSTSKSNKKVKLQQAPPAKLPSPTFEDEDSQEDEGEDAEISAFGEEEDGEGFEDLEVGSEGVEDEDEGEDSEVNEFEMEGELGEDEDEEDEDLIDDDGEDLMAALGDEDEEGSVQDDGSDSDEPPPVVAPAPIKKANVRNSRAPAPLKPAELRALAFAELTASPISSILSTQVTSLLNPLTPPLAATSPLHPLLKSLHAHITSLPSQKTSTLSGLRKKGIHAPRIEKETKSMAKSEMEWEKPRAEDVRIVGSWAWGGSLKVNGEYFVDMVIALPADLLQHKDYLYPRFLTKATHYLTVLSTLLPASLGPTTLSFVPLPLSQGWSLEIRSAHVKGSSTEKIGLSCIKGAVLRLRIVHPLDTFPLAKISPLSNIARPSIPNPDNTSPFPATPIHCSSLLLSSLSTKTSHLKYFHNLSTSHSSYADSIRLLQSWASKRAYGSTLGLTDEFWAWCVARTLNWGSAGEKKLGGSGTGGEAWAGWRKAVEWLAGVNWSEGVWFRVEGNAAFEKDDFRKAFAGKPLFVDPSGTVNLVAGVDIATLDMLKQDAKTTIALLLSGADDVEKFEAAFLKEIIPAERFDNYARITIPHSILSAIEADEYLDHPNVLTFLTASISSTLRRALGNRARAFQLTCPAPSSSASSSSTTLTLGLLLDSAEAGRLVDQGPSAEDEPACIEFRSFWGARSELRRFKDGAILESVVWEESTTTGLGQQRNKVVGKLVKYILESRHSILPSHVDFFAGAMDHLIVEPFAIRRAVYLEDSVASNKGFGNIMGVFDALSKELTGLSDLPLTISAVQPSSPGLRYSTIFTPSPRRLKDFERFPDSTKYIEVHDIILTLEGSGRWPEDLEGVQKIKAAFLAKIAEGLMELHTIVKAELAFDVSSRAIDDNVSLEILTASGYAFRARIYYERSLLLLKSRNAQLLQSSEDTEDPSSALFNERFVHSPRHHAALATLQHHFTSYSPTVRLVKRWFSAHMLTSHFSLQHIELICASVFVDPSSLYEVPHSGAAGFARVMGKLASWNWRDEPMLVCLYTFSVATTSGRRPNFPTAEKATARESFEKLRLADAAVGEYAWRICTEEDAEGKVWGRGTDKVAASRARSLAKATLKTLNDGLMAGNLIVEQLFSAPLDGYNFLIHLDAKIVPRHYQSISPEAFALASNSRSSVVAGSLMSGMEELVDEVRFAWDPVSEFVAQLNQMFGSVFLIFYSPDGSPTLGAVWNPTAEAARPWKVGIEFPTKPLVEANGKAKVVLDKAAILREVERLGHGLVKKVTLQS